MKPYEMLLLHYILVRVFGNEADAEEVIATVQDILARRKAASDAKEGAK